jgi:hypothetical protein
MHVASTTPWNTRVKRKGYDSFVFILAIKSTTRIPRRL